MYDLPVSPSDMFRGAVYATRPECRTNPDWIAQAANSLREVLYPFYGPHAEGVPTNKQEILEKFGSVTVDEKAIQEMGRVYGRVEGLAHHGNVKKNRVDYLNFKPEDFDVLLSEYEEVMMGVLTRHVDLHATVDTVVDAGPPVAVVTTV